MEGNSSLVCACGRIFLQSSGLARHRRFCKLSNKCLASALETAKKLWKGTKRRRLQSDAPQAYDQLAPVGLIPQSSIVESISATEGESNQNEVDDSHLSIMERRPWAKRLNRRLPLRFRDLLPQALPYPMPSSSSPPSPKPPSTMATTPSNSETKFPPHRLRQVFTTERNIFGLFRHYEAVQPPSHDPEEYTSLDELPDIASEGSASDQVFHPYPNRSSFRLGDWFWNGGVQKSQSSFRELLDIVGDPNFKPADVRDTRWGDIDRALGSDDDQGEWMDEYAGWTSSPVSIHVPYQRRRGIAPSPSVGPREFTETGFYHRNLISVIREAITNPATACNFHYEPYELNWHPESNTHPLRVQGELYTSPAFIDAHRELQESPAELGCDLPQVVVALMFWSDITHLTSFGDATLWPLYLYFGNESKYRRSKPSCHACHHVAYFQKVSEFRLYVLFNFQRLIAIILTVASEIQRLRSAADSRWPYSERTLHGLLCTRVLARAMGDYPNR